MKSTKRGQFYLIAAAIIIFILVGLVAVSNYVYVKQEPKKFYDIGDILGREGAKVVEYAAITQSDMNATINSYLEIYADYLDKNINANFELIIFYGSVKDQKISAKRFYRSSTGGVSICFSGTPCQTIGSDEVRIADEQATVIENPKSKTVNVTITSERAGSLSVEVPILKDNNFVFVMSTSDEFNNYIQTNFQEEQ
jgi:hypothetical protein